MVGVEVCRVVGVEVCRVVVADTEDLSEAHARNLVHGSVERHVVGPEPVDDEDVGPVVGSFAGFSTLSW